jgi:hypothetical protein
MLCQEAITLRIEVVTTNKIYAKYSQRNRDYPDKDFRTTHSSPRMPFYGYRYRDYPDKDYSVVTALAFRYLWPLLFLTHLQTIPIWVGNREPQK